MACSLPVAERIDHELSRVIGVWFPVRVPRLDAITDVVFDTANAILVAISVHEVALII